MNIMLYKKGLKLYHNTSSCNQWSTFLAEDGLCDCVTNRYQNIMLLFAPLNDAMLKYLNLTLIRNNIVLKIKVSLS